MTMTFLHDRQQLERSAQVMIFTENVLTLTIFIPTFLLFLNMIIVKYLICKTTCIYKQAKHILKLGMIQMNQYCTTLEVRSNQNLVKLN